MKPNSFLSISLNTRRVSCRFLSWLSGLLASRSRFGRLNKWKATRRYSRASLRKSFTVVSRGFILARGTSISLLIFSLHCCSDRSISLSLAAILGSYLRLRFSGLSMGRFTAVFSLSPTICKVSVNCLIVSFESDSRQYAIGLQFRLTIFDCLRPILWASEAVRRLRHPKE